MKNKIFLIGFILVTILLVACRNNKNDTNNDVEGNNENTQIEEQIEVNNEDGLTEGDVEADDEQNNIEATDNNTDQNNNNEQQQSSEEVTKKAKYVGFIDSLSIELIVDSANLSFAVDENIYNKIQKLGLKDGDDVKVKYYYDKDLQNNVILEINKM